MKIYKLYYSSECNPVETYQLRKFMRENELWNRVSDYYYIKGSDATQQLSYLNSCYDRQLAEQSVTLPVKLRYFLLTEEDSNDARLIKFIKGKDEILSYFKTNLL